MKSKTSRKSTFFIILALILALAYTAFFGIENYYGDIRQIYFKGANDIRWGIDINGGVEAVFAPADSKLEVTDDDINAAKNLVETRLVNKNIVDYEVYADTTNNRIVVRFPSNNQEEGFDANEAVNELSASAMVVFRKGTAETGEVILQGSEDVKSATAALDPQTNDPIVVLNFTDKGKQKFTAATAEAIGSSTSSKYKDTTGADYSNQSFISIWLATTTYDESGKETTTQTNISIASVDQVISSNECIISNKQEPMTTEETTNIAERINGGKLPFSLAVKNLQIISPTLGSNALNVMVIAGIIAFAIVCLIMIVRYRVNGAVAAVALLGQLAGTIACISGFFANTNSFTLTIPGIAGIILSVGVGVDCNVIAAERIRDEFKKGKPLDAAINSGFKNSLSAIIDGNVTIVIVSIVLMGAFGSPDSFLGKIFSPIMSIFGTSITGTIYSFGYTLLIGVIFNLIMGVLASKYMVRSLSQFKCMRNPAFYGGKKNG